VKMWRDMKAPHIFALALVILVFTWKTIVSILMLSTFFHSKWLSDIPIWDVPALPAFWVLVFGVLQIEASAFIKGCEAAPKRYAEADVRAVRCTCLWAAWIFPLNLACTVFVPEATSVLWTGLFGSTNSGSAALHIVASLLSLASWLSTVSMTVASRSTETSARMQVEPLMVSMPPVPRNPA